MEFRIYTEAPKMVVAQAAEKVDWGVNLVQAPMLWQATQGEGVKVAVLDTGIDFNHPDLAANVKGYVNFTTSNVQDAMDRQGHGSHCSGIIAAVHNEVGVVGVAPKAELYGVKVLGDNGSGSIDAIISGIDWCIQNKMDLISMSLGCSVDPGPALHDAIKRAHQAGIIVVAASGNESTSCGWPAAYDECIAVGAVDAAMDKAGFSNFGQEVDVAAPGVNILSTYMNGQYASLSGTSMATPMVTGVIALILSLMRKQGLQPTPEMIISLISQRSVDLGTDGDDDSFGNGLVNVYKLVKNYNKA